MPHNPSHVEHDEQSGSDPAFPAPGQYPAREYYERLLLARVVAGRKLIDELSHGIPKVHSLYSETSRLDEMLENFSAYRRDYRSKVVAAEERRVHVPGLSRPKDDRNQPCLLCRKTDAGVALDMIIPLRGVA